MTLRVRSLRRNRKLNSKSNLDSAEGNNFRRTFSGLKVRHRRRWVWSTYIIVSLRVYRVITERLPRVKETVLTYATVLAYYLYLRASPKYAARPELLRLHPVFQRLLVLKQTLANLEDLDIGFSDSEEEDDDYEDEFSDDEDEIASEGMRDSLDGPLEGLEDGELGDLISGFSQPVIKVTEGTAMQPKKKKTVAKEKKKSQKIVYDVEEPTLLKSTGSASEQVGTTFTSDPYGEATTIGSADAADKSARKKALRFHAARIESTSHRRQNARNAMGGDEDIPYKVRRKEAEKNNKRHTNLGEGGEDLDDADPEPVPEKRKRSREEVDEEESDDDGYYSLVKKQKSEQKKQKKAVYDAEKEANR